MNKISITFTHEGKEYKGTLDEVHGAAGRTWHLMIDKYYYGPLLFVNDKFVFHPQLDENKWMKEFEGYFGEVITLYYE